MEIARRKQRGKEHVQRRDNVKAVYARLHPEVYELNVREGLGTVQSLRGLTC